MIVFMPVSRPILIVGLMAQVITFAGVSSAQAQSSSGRTPPTQTRDQARDQARGPVAPPPTAPVDAPNRRTAPVAGTMAPSTTSSSAVNSRTADFPARMNALYGQIGRLPFAQLQPMAQALLTEAERSGDPINLANALTALSMIHLRNGDYETAEAMNRRILILPPDQLVLSPAWGGLGEALSEQGRYDEAVTAFQTAIALNEAEGGRPQDLSNLLNLLAIVRGNQGLYPEGEDLFRRAIDVAVAGNADEARRVAAANLAWNLHQQGRHVEAEAALRATIEDIRAAEGETTPNYGASVTNLAGELQAQGRDAEALVEFRRALPVFETALGRNHPQTAWTLNAMARSVAKVESLAEAELLFLEAMGLSLATRPAGHPETTRMSTDMAEYLMQLNRNPEALSILRELGLIVRRRAVVETRRNATQASAEFDRHRNIYRLQVQAAWDVGASDPINHR